MNYDEALKCSIFRFISGSHAYGTNRPDSDQDVRGVFIAPLSKGFELFQSSFVGGGTIGDRLRAALENIEDGVYEAATENIKRALEPENGDLNFSVETVHRPGVDEEQHELRKFLKLAAESNPNIIEFLYVDRLIIHETEVWKKIRSHRDKFLSRKARWTFSGYAKAQLNRIKLHRGYLLSPPSHKPTRQEFGLQENTSISKENQGAILSLPDQWVNDSARDYVRKEKDYHKARSEWHSYTEWERKRNPARKEMERKYGYDVKHAMHLVRLARMGSEILSDGVVKVFRPDADELRQILRGEWPYEKVLEVAENLDASLDALYAKSTLRDRPDHKGISDLYQEICEEHYGIKL